MFGPKRKWYEGGDSYIMRNFVISTCAKKHEVDLMNKVKWARNVACVGEVRYLYKILVGKSEGKTLLKDRHRLEVNFKMNLS